MRLSKLYSNNDKVFAPIEFRSELNVVLAEIRVPENRNKDTHNLGKTTLGRLLDFCFLAKKDPSFFLFKHEEKFEKFVFYLEVELPDKTYLTLRRDVGDASKASFKRHEAPSQNYSLSPIDSWDHERIPFKRGRQILDGLLDWRAIEPWGYRKCLGYLIRSQDDYRDVFKLSTFGGKHSYWKPFLTRILGFDDSVVAAHYEKEQQLQKAEELASSISQELGGSIADISKVDGLLLLKTKEAKKAAGNTR